VLSWSCEDIYEGGYEVTGEKHRKSEHSAADSVVDKIQEYRRSKGKPDLLDKVIDKAQDAGVVNKAFDTLKRRFFGR
jgi:membrane carboxypeptidase/penicillin-binding protein